MIRQAISCDICAAEKRQTNHWFVAYEQGGELRVSGWTSRHRLRPDSKHLCGQTCLHKLVDEFMAKSIAKRAQRNGEAVEAAEVAEAEAEAAVMTDTSLANAKPAGEVESSARLLPVPPPAPSPVPAKPVHHPLPEIVTMPARPYPKEIAPLPADTLRYASRRWHAEAWERERERELHAIENHTEIAARRRTSA
ncbi:MAG: hypothetical protein ABSD59_11565 [Terracidiphilus sp.]|jgi:hypothetical protein